MSFKKLVEAISQIKSEEDMNRVCGEIDMSYQHDKITWNDHQTLYRIMNLLKY